MLGCNWRTERVTDITQHIIDRSHRRYNLADELPAVTEAWTLLVNSSYAQDLSVQDGTGASPGTQTQHTSRDILYELVC